VRPPQFFVCGSCSDRFGSNLFFLLFAHYSAHKYPDWQLFIYFVLFLFDTSITSPLNLFICIKNKRIFIQSTRPSKSLIDSFRAHKTQGKRNRKSIDRSIVGSMGQQQAFGDLVYGIWYLDRKKERRPGSIIQIRITHVQSQQLCRLICFLYLFVLGPKRNEKSWGF